jgi:hypothetical protein
MASRKSKIQDSKISPNFTSRLERLKPHEKVRAIILLNLETSAEGKNKRLTDVDRRLAMQSIRQAAQFVLPEIDQILQNFDGRRLNEEVTALGSVAIETTATGILSLAQSEGVKAILEDQTASLLR